LHNFSISQISWLEGYKVEIRKIIYLQVLDLSGESSYPKGTFGRDLWLSNFFMHARKFCYNMKPNFQTPPLFFARLSQHSADTPTKFKEWASQESLRNVYCRVTKIVEKVHPHVSRFDDQKNYFLGGNS